MLFAGCRMDGASDQGIEIRCIPRASSHEKSVNFRLENQLIRIGGVDTAAVQQGDILTGTPGYFTKSAAD